MKAAASKLWRPAARIGLAVATAGATEIAVAAVDPMLEAGSKELESASKDFWKKEEGKRAAMTEFRIAISALSKPTDERVPASKLVIVVDELDRCRPDYALALLETIKHFFFNVPNVHFVLGVNLSELQNSVRARYGQEVDAGLYLQKFISLTMRLPRHTKPKHGNLAELEYFSKTAAEMKLNAALVDEIEYYLERILPQELLSIRGLQRLLTQIALVPQSPTKFEQFSGGYKILISGLIILKHAFPATYKKAELKTLTIDDIISCFNTGIQEESWRYDSGEIIEHAWRATIAPDTLNEVEHGKYQGSFGSFGQKPSVDLIPSLISEYVETFVAPD